tara:strand:+ start:3446 stop:3607 length:162 start_codon:yes stop_codon:yes gene_type:complete
LIHHAIWINAPELTAKQTARNILAAKTAITVSRARGQRRKPLRPLPGPERDQI